MDARRKAQQQAYKAWRERVDRSDRRIAGDEPPLQPQQIIAEHREMRRLQNYWLSLMR